MIKAKRISVMTAFAVALLTATIFYSTAKVNAQALTAGSITGSVVDPNGAVVPKATVTLSNAITGYQRTATADADGTFRFDNVPPNNYQLVVSALGFASSTQTLTVRTAVPITLKVPLDVTSATATVTVSSSAANMIENIATTHTDVDQ